jgi:Arm DNA-binding domain
MKLKIDATTARQTLDEGERERFIWDTELVGFGLRLRKRHDDSGILRTWVAQYRASGRTRRHSLGAPAKVSLTAAREAARKLLAHSALGHDPQAEKTAKRVRAARTFASVAEAYLAQAASRLRPSTMRAGRLYLAGDYLAPLHGMPISEISRADVAACLTSVARRHSANTAAEVRRWASTLFVWSMAEGWLDANPINGTRQPDRAATRERVLDDAELVAIWQACDGDDDYSRIVRLLILTGARRQEIGGICWSLGGTDTAA